MLAVLKIKNLALVEDVVWELGSGLVGVTGQTGAGKSMIVGALKLILGERANRDLIRTGESKCSVEAVFQLSSNLAQVNGLLIESGVEPCDGGSLIVKRSFGNGNSQFVNCSPCTLSVLKKLGGLLIDLHGPNEHHSLFSQERQLKMLDAFAGTASELEAYAVVFRAWNVAIRELESFKNLGSPGDREIELLRYQLDEISNAGLIQSELEGLERRYNQARNAAKLIGSANHSADALQSAVLSLTEARKHLAELQNLDPESAQFIEGFDSARLEIEELDSNLREYTGDLEVDPAEMVAMENRIDQVELLKKKYGQTIDEVFRFEKEARVRLDKVDHGEEELDRLGLVVAKARKKVDKAMSVLRKKRKAALADLEAQIGRHLEGLGFIQSVFEIKMETLETPHLSGGDEIDFLFGPNPGEPVKALRVIASSGEMSRVMLAVKSALADQDETPLLVFDEIDANVGGEVAGAVGVKMAALGERHQVISITHMPQVASLAACHYLVTKEVADGTTISKIARICGSDRVDEIARMLGGVGEESVALAKKMLG